MSDFTGSPPIDAKLTGAAHPPVLLAGAIGGNDNNKDDGLYKNIFFFGKLVILYDYTKKIF